MSRLARLLVPAAVLALSSAAHAEPVDEARTYFTKGVELFEKDDFVGALEQFSLADKAHHAPSISYNLARVHESLGHAQAAHDAYVAYVSEAGADGDFLDAATVALARIKSRSTRLRIESNPSGALVRVNGAVLPESTPTAMMVFKGNHRVDVELDGWVDGREVIATGGGNSQELKFDRPPPKPLEPPAAAPPRPERREFRGVTFGLGWALNYSALVVKSKPDTTASGAEPADYEKSSVRFGVTLESGWAVTPNHVLMLRGQCGLGSDSKALFSLGSLSPMLSYRASPRWWLGGGAIFASSEKNKGATYSPLLGADNDDTVRVSGDFAWGPVAELGLVLSDQPGSQWLLTMFPSLLLNTGEGQSTLYVPLVVGHRWY